MKALFLFAALTLLPIGAGAQTGAVYSKSMSWPPQSSSQNYPCTVSARGYTVVWINDSCGEYIVCPKVHDTAREYVVRVDTVKHGAPQSSPYTPDVLLYDYDTVWAAKVAVYLTPDDLAQLIRLLRWHEFLPPGIWFTGGYTYEHRDDSTCQHRRAK